MIKGLCILLIIITHYNWQNPVRSQYFFRFWVDQAVPVFLIISGYVYALSYQKRGIVSIEGGLHYDFVIDKLIRYSLPFLYAFLFEMYWASVPIEKWGRLFLQGGIGPGSYYYPILIQFIFVFPFLLYLVRTFDFNGLIMCFLLNVLFEVCKEPYFVDAREYRLLIFRYLFLISAGCYIAIGKTRPRNWLIFFCFLIGLYWQYVTGYMGYKPTINNMWTSTGFMDGLYIIPIAGVIFRHKEKIITISLLEAIGRASYNIFLFQMVFYAYFAKSAVYEKISSMNLQLIMCMVLCTGGGYLFYIFESYITHRIQQLLRGHGYFNNIMSLFIVKIERYLVIK